VTLVIIFPGAAVIILFFAGDPVAFIQPFTQIDETAAPAAEGFVG